MSRAVREVRSTPPIWRQWNLVWNFAQRDLKSKFKGSALGWAWSLVVPLATLAIYTVVFSVVFRMPPPQMGSGRDGLFVIWLFAGLTAWTFFASSINAGISGLIGTGALLKKIFFPAYAPVLGAMVAQGVQSLIELGLYLCVLLVLGNLGWTWLLVPFWAVLLVLFTSGLATALAVLNVHTRDLAHLVAVFLQLGFYATPIIYTLDYVPAERWGLPLRAMVEWSPISLFVETLRDLTYGLEVGSGTAWLGMAAWAAASLALGAWVHRRRGGDLGEEL
ncbi:ABC transporter permease [Cellulomonas sp.]|uniref:ABC transporter permease n=1 Tax=Cellulomonas sp. TaxID=40001 RepID=UPI001B034587|nr:ABC transporter permease [Cellulomonas sp.]MBO9556698.1 ABC transporter permease [Cellulomonas sp.]